MTAEIKKEEEESHDTKEESHDTKEESHDKKESHGVEDMEVCGTKDQEVSEDEKRDEESNMDTENNDSPGKEKKDDKIEQDEIEKDQEKAKDRVFRLVVVNSYGSQEVNRLKDDDELLKLTSEPLYIELVQCKD